MGRAEEGITVKFLNTASTTISLEIEIWEVQRVDGR